MVSRGRKTAADAARLFKSRSHPATVSQLLARQSEAVIKERELPEKFATQDQNEEIFMRFMNDSTFREVASTWLAREAFRRLGQPATVETYLRR